MKQSSPLSGRFSTTAQRQLAVVRLRAAFAELSGELNGPMGLRWVIGAPFNRLDRARSLISSFAHLFHQTERTELERVFRDYTRAFDAVAARSRLRNPGVTEVRLSLPITEMVEAAAAAADCLCDTLSAEA